LIKKKNIFSKEAHQHKRCCLSAS